jgi:hypothetical protein
VPAPVYPQEQPALQSLPAPGYDDGVGTKLV